MIFMRLLSTYTTPSIHFSLLATRCHNRTKVDRQRDFFLKHLESRIAPSPENKKKLSSHVHARALSRAVFTGLRSFPFFVIRPLLTLSLLPDSSTMATQDQATLLLRKQLQELNKNPVEGFSAGVIDESDIFKWEVMVIGPPDTPYEGGFFKSHLIFPKDYPVKPPKLKFISEIWHPNIGEWMILWDVILFGVAGGRRGGHSLCNCWTC